MVAACSFWPPQKHLDAPELSGLEGWVSMPQTPEARGERLKLLAPSRGMLLYSQPIVLKVECAHSEIMT